MGGLADRIRYAFARPLGGDHTIDPMRELAEVRREVGLEPGSSGGSVTFTGRGPIVSNPLPFATMAAVALDCSTQKHPAAIIGASPTRSSCQAHQVSLPCPWFRAAPAWRSGWLADFAGWVVTLQ
jgi:hypothetical protein